MGGRHRCPGFLEFPQPLFLLEDAYMCALALARMGSCISLMSVKGHRLPRIDRLLEFCQEAERILKRGR